MKTEELENLTEGETVVMKAVWDCQKEPTLSDVLEIVTSKYEKDWKPQTVSTFLAKLCRKNYIKLHRNGKVYTYEIIVPEADHKRRLYMDHIRFWNNGDMEEFLLEMYKNGDLTKETLEKLHH